ncbi:hypothetical protein ABZ630_32245, partial [Streptomyces albidoflavus]
MTAPLNPPPPPHGRPGYDPWQLPEGAHPDHPRGTERDEPLGREIRRAALTGLAVVVLGLLLGFLWSRLAPHVPLVSDGEAVYLKDTEGEQAIGVRRGGHRRAGGRGARAGPRVRADRQQPRPLG